MGNTTPSRIGRNDPCWCGSGRKYKQCHLTGDRGRSPSPLFGPRRIDRSLVLEGEAREPMRAAGRFNAQLMDAVRGEVKIGRALAEIDRFVHDYTVDHGHRPACLGYKGYPKSCCTSVNEVVCHGIPDDYRLRDGDIVNVDLTSIVDGWHGDQSETFLVGEVSQGARALAQCAFDSLWRAIDALEPSCTVGVIGQTITSFAVGQGFSVVDSFQGHGLGRSFHQEPSIPHVPERRSARYLLEPGVCFTIEPMINEGVPGCVVDRRDGWTARTADGKLSAQFEHTVMMTEEGPEILTLTEHGPQRGDRLP